VPAFLPAFDLPVKCHRGAGAAAYIALSESSRTPHYRYYHCQHGRQKS
jgi:hypothetical protein